MKIEQCEAMGRAGKGMEGFDVLGGSKKKVRGKQVMPVRLWEHHQCSMAEFAGFLPPNAGCLTEHAFTDSKVLRRFFLPIAVL